MFLIFIIFPVRSQLNITAKKDFIFADSDKAIITHDFLIDFIKLQGNGMILQVFLMKQMTSV